MIMVPVGPPGPYSSLFGPVSMQVFSQIPEVFILLQLGPQSKEVVEPGSDPSTWHGVVTAACGIAPPQPTPATLRKVVQENRERRL
ncbi:hypothetical protein V3C99_010888 [Haemonchus contortus]